MGYLDYELKSELSYLFSLVVSVIRNGVILKKFVNCFFMCKLFLCFQVEVFSQQLELAKELKRPASIHCVRAYGDLLQIMKYAFVKLNLYFFTSNTIFPV